MHVFTSDLLKRRTSLVKKYVSSNTLQKQPSALFLIEKLNPIILFFTLRKYQHLILFFVSMVGTQACVEDIENCISRSGPIKEQTYHLDTFSSIEANDGLHIKLHPSSEQWVVVEAGKNVISQIGLVVEEGILRIEDYNRCDWSRSYQERTVHIYHPNISKIIQNGFGTISSDDTLQFQNLQIEARRGIGDIDLKIHADKLTVISSRYGTISLAGEVDLLHVQYLSNNAIFDGRQLKAHEIRVFQKSNNDFHLYPLQVLRGKLLRRGDIYLHHEPAQMDVEVSGTGRIIPFY
jgi:hypothetical protein